MSGTVALAAPAPVAPPAAPTRARTAWIDVARGLGIILVVFGHALRALHPQIAAAPAWVQTTDRVIYSFHMPLFFLLSGLFAWRSLAAGRARFFNDKLYTVVYPYFLWSLIEGGIELAIAPYANSPLTLRDLLSIPIAPIEQFWFLYALFLCQLVVLASFPRRAMLAAVTVVGVAAATWLGTGPIWLRALAFLPYVAIGVLASAALLRLGQARGTALRVGIVAAALWVVLLTLTDATPPLLVALALGLTGTLMTIGAAVLIEGGPAAALLELLGRTSMAIYVMHTIFSAGARVLPRMMGLTIDYWVMLVGTTLAGIVGPLAIWWVAERFGWGALLGIGPRRRARPAIAVAASPDGRLP